MFRRGLAVLTLAAIAIACSQLSSKEKSHTPQEDERDASVQPDPEPWDGYGGEPFDASFVPFEASCPDAMPEAGAPCPDFQGAYDCRYDDDGSVASCECKTIPEADWWVCGDR